MVVRVFLSVNAVSDVVYSVKRVNHHLSWIKHAASTWAGSL